MNPNDLAAITVYSDLLTVLKERGYPDAEAYQMFLDLTAQAEMEVVEEMMLKLSDEQLAKLDSLPANATGSEIAELLALDAELVDRIRAEKTAKLISELAQVVDSDDDQIVTE